MAHYTKTYSSPAQLVTLLQSRGLHIENVARTENYLRHIGYYRFSAYLYPLLTTPKENHVFKPGATFNQALDMYRFDRPISVSVSLNTSLTSFRRTTIWRIRLILCSPLIHPLIQVRWAFPVVGKTNRCGNRYNIQHRGGRPLKEIAYITGTASDSLNREVSRLSSQLHFITKISVNEPWMFRKYTYPYVPTLLFAFIHVSFTYIRVAAQPTPFHHVNPREWTVNVS